MSVGLGERLELSKDRLVKGVTYCRAFISSALRKVKGQSLPWGRLFQAVRGVGGVARLVRSSYEVHAYRLLENVQLVQCESLD